MDSERYRRIGAVLLALGAAMMVIGLTGRRLFLIAAIVLYGAATIVFLRGRRR
jgi:hypothetical protein